MLAGGDSLQPRLRGSEAVALYCVGVEISAIEVARLLLRAAFRCVFGQRFGNRANLVFRPVGQLDE